MPSYEHNKLVGRIVALSHSPTDATELEVWLSAQNHLQLLEDNARDDDELIVAARDGATSVQSVVVREDKLYPLDESDLLGWQGHGFEPRAEFVRHAGKGNVQIEESRDLWMSKTLAGAQRLTFGRQLRDFGDDDGAYYEILQEYLHLFGVHWRPNESAYCDFDEHGDLRHVVSITLRKGKGETDLVSFRREQLEQYLAATDSVLVRMFDFELLSDCSSIDGWPDLPEEPLRRGEHLFANRRLNLGVGSFTRGVQIVRPARPKAEILERIGEAQRTESSVEFTAHDWRNDQTIKMSTDPWAKSGSFELAIVCFRPRVLLEYKGDWDVYTVDEKSRTIYCRSGWQIKYDTNEAGQIFVYAYRLYALPYSEQLRWKSFNDKPKAGLSDRAFVRDIAGQGAEATPVVKMLITLEEWDGENVPWWKLRNRRLLEQVNTPYAESRDEWAQAFEDLAKLVVEGFVVATIHEKLRELGIEFNKDDRSITLLEKLVFGAEAVANGARLGGLRATQEIRNKVAVHAPGGRAAEIENEAKQQHGSFATHFQSVCAEILDDIALIEEAFAHETHK